MATNLILEMYEKYPSMAKAAERSPLAAIGLFCLGCMGVNDAVVSRCTGSPSSVHPCPLYGFRFRSRPPQETGQDVQETVLDQIMGEDTTPPAKTISRGPIVLPTSSSDEKI